MLWEQRKCFFSHFGLVDSFMSWYFSCLHKPSEFLKFFWIYSSYANDLHYCLLFSSWWDIEHPSIFDDTAFYVDNCHIWSYASDKSTETEKSRGSTQAYMSQPGFEPGAWDLQASGPFRKWLPTYVYFLQPHSSTLYFITDLKTKIGFRKY